MDFKIDDNDLEEKLERIEQARNWSPAKGPHPDCDD